MKESSGLQWHPEFFAALQIDLEKEVVPLQFFSEWNLTKKPLQIDVLVVKKESKETSGICRCINQEHTALYLSIKLIDFPSKTPSEPKP